MKVGDSVILADRGVWCRIGLVLGFERNMVLVFWGEDFPHEEEYFDQLEVI